MITRRGFGLVLAFLLLAGALPAQEPAMTPEETANFLLNAEVINSRHTSKGVTSPYRLTMRLGNVTHDAHFQPIDETRPTREFTDGSVELNFRDSYKYNIAAYELSRLLGLDHMMPVTVFRKWSGMSGSTAWWLPAKMDEADRLRKNLEPPDKESWGRQMHRKRVFAELVYDTDPNQTNVLIGEDWKIYMIDFTRAFRLRSDLHEPHNLERCDRDLLEKLRQLDAKGLAASTKGYLTSAEVKAVMQRRNKLVVHFEQLIKDKGESAVLY